MNPIVDQFRSPSRNLVHTPPATMSFKYRKKPIVVEAVQYFPDMGEHTASIPVWLIEACTNGTVTAQGKSTYILTPEGRMRVSDGDWIVRGTAGELYPCKPEIFSAIYEKEP